MGFRAHLVFGSYEKRTTCHKNCGPINLYITNLFSLNLKVPMIFSILCLDFHIVTPYDVIST